MTQVQIDQVSDTEEVVTPLMLDGTYLSRNFATLGPSSLTAAVWKNRAAVSGHHQQWWQEGPGGSRGHDHESSIPWQVFRQDVFLSDLAGELDF